MQIAPLLTNSECAQILRVSDGALRQIISKGTAPKHMKIGTNVRFHVDDIQAWIDGKRGIQTPALVSNDNHTAKRGRPRKTVNLALMA